MIKGVNPPLHVKPSSAPPTAKSSVSVSASPSMQSVPRAAVPQSAAPHSAATLAASAGLPADRLSSSIISFARFFQLPLKPQILADIRRQAFSAPQPAQQTTGQQTAAQQITAQVREALALSAAAAESKGTELQSKALESYAAAVDPDLRRHQKEHQGKRNKERNEKDDKTTIKTGSITADILKKLVFDYSKDDELLEILNKLPGKNGQRWVVLPFDFINDDIQYKVSMRVLLDGDKSLNRAVYMLLDICNCDLDKRWVFILESANETPAKLCVYLPQQVSKEITEQVRQELSQVLGVSIENISIKTNTESFPYEGDSGDYMPSVDENI
ncbi:MAG: hypothetical protein FWD28_02495 [Treponema sp.]|nr:hypothetical protein [Treponema sp.]